MSKSLGKCDVCKEKEAKFFYRNTSAAYCGSAECSRQMDERYDLHCKEMDAQFALEKQMEEEYGYDS